MNSKEQAEKLVNDVYVLWCDTPKRMTVPMAVREAIPLAELLEVAKAAIKYEQTNSITARLECGLAIKALRATGKVEL